MNWKLGRDSFHKLIVWFADGNTRTRYSIDWKHKYSKTRDPQIGLNRLYKMIAEWGAKAKTVEIYKNEYGTKSGEVIERYFNGIKQ